MLARNRPSHGLLQGSSISENGIGRKAFRGNRTVHVREELEVRALQILANHEGQAAQQYQGDHQTQI
jgi:hypothetical protein